MPTKKILFFFFLILLIPLVSAELTPLNKDNLQEKNAGINPLLGDVGLGKQFSIEVIAYPELDNLKKELQKFTNYRLQISFNPEHLQHIDSQNLVPGNWVPQDNINNNDLNNPSKSGDITFAMEGSSLEDIFKSKPTSLAKFTFLTKDDLIPPQQTVISIQDLTIITTEVPIVNTLFTSTTLTVTEDDPGFDYGDIPPYTPPPEYFPVGGQSCTPEWDCSSWDFCNKDKIQA